MYSLFFLSSRRRHTTWPRDWSSDVCSSDLLLLDEPTEGLAPLLVREVGRVIHQLKLEGLSILLVEQNLPLALSVADRTHILSRGQIVHSSRPDELLANEDVKSRYLGVA